MVRLLKAIIVMMTYSLHKHFHELHAGAEHIDAQFYYQTDKIYGLTPSSKVSFILMPSAFGLIVILFDFFFENQRINYYSKYPINPFDIFETQRNSKKHIFGAM